MSTNTSIAQVVEKVMQCVDTLRSTGADTVQSTIRPERRQRFVLTLDRQDNSICVETEVKVRIFVPLCAVQ